MHNLGFYFIEQLPNQLANPVAILKSKNQKNSLVVVSEMIDTNNNTVLIAVHLDKNGRININNEVTSAYGKGGYKSFIEQNRKSGNVLYENKNIGLASLPADGLQLSAVEATTDPIFNIYDFNRNYNTNSENSERPDNIVSHLKRYKIISSKNNTDVASSMTYSTDYINSPLGDHVHDVTLTANNIISDTNHNSNANLEDNRNVLPTATDSIKQTVENNVLPKAVEEISTKTEVMLYSDYSSALEKYGVGDTPNAWGDMTEAWLYDKDAVKNKT